MNSLKGELHVHIYVLTYFRHVKIIFNLVFLKIGHNEILK